MRLAAFLPKPSLAYLRGLLPKGWILEARSWNDLDRLVQDPAIGLALIDPSADGILKIGAATRVLSKYRHVPFVGYMPLTNENMKAVATLSGQGLAHALLHPLRDSSAITHVANEHVTRKLGYEFLSFFEASMATRAPKLSNAIRDLLERPQRYFTVGDLSEECSLSKRQLYRVFEEAGLGNPSRFVSGAKIFRAYNYLRAGSDVRSTAKQIGYSSRILGEKTYEIFGCSPLCLGHERNEAEVMVQIIEWIYKPRMDQEFDSRPTA